MRLVDLETVQFLLVRVEHITAVESRLVTDTRLIPVYGLKFITHTVCIGN